MLANSSRSGVMCGLFMLGFAALVMGLTFTFTMPSFNTTFETVTSLILWGGVLLVLAGIVLVPSFRREVGKLQSILDIVIVRKEVTISEISSETGLDREYVQDVISKQLKIGLLFGHLEGDLFVCDTSRYRGHRGKKRGMFEATD
jgi:hypothetical protein